MSKLIFERLKDKAANVLGIELEEFTMDATWVDDLGADSLDLVELVIDIENDFDIDISDADAEGLVTVKDTVEYLDKKIPPGQRAFQNVSLFPAMPPSLFPVSDKPEEELALPIIRIDRVGSDKVEIHFAYQDNDTSLPMFYRKVTLKSSLKPDSKGRLSLLREITHTIRAQINAFEIEFINKTKMEVSERERYEVCGETRSQTGRFTSKKSNVKEIDKEFFDDGTRPLC